MKTVRLITCDSSFQARLILGALENEGIAGILHNENSSNILKGYINNIGVDIFVYEDEYEKALKVLEQNEIIAKQMKYCPYCHSDNIEYTLKKEKKQICLEIYNDGEQIRDDQMEHRGRWIPCRSNRSEKARSAAYTGISTI